MDIVVQQEQIITINDPIQIEWVRDNFERQRIVAKIQHIPRQLILWDGPEQYIAAGIWTNDTAIARATEVLALSSIPWL